MADKKFLTTGASGNLVDQLSQGMNRVAQYQTLQRGFDARSGNIIIGNGRIVIGQIAKDTYGIAYYDINGNLISTTNEAIVTKYDTSGNIISIDNGESTIYYDSSNARILIGKAPDDGRIGIWISKTGVDVITELGG
jgi:hypothetical protein